jgi:putative addiction module CopG family antidote
MPISLTPETEQRVKELMQKGGYSSPDEVVIAALETLEGAVGADIEDLDEETQSAIAEGIAQADAGQTRPWAEVREELRARFLK